MKSEVSAKVLENVRRKTKKFSAQKIGLISKVDADNELVLTRVRTHISHVLSILKGEKIIDEYKVSNPIDIFGVDGNVVCFSIKKNGSSNFVHIFTNGEHIVLRDGNFLINFGDIGADYIRCEKVTDVDEYDWVTFSDVLLDFIYKSIYNVTKVNELSIFGVKNVQKL